MTATVLEGEIRGPLEGPLPFRNLKLKATSSIFLEGQFKIRHQPRYPGLKPGLGSS